MLPQTPVSAVDCVGPAIEWTKRAMLRPFSWAKWWRIGLLGAAVGELSSFSCNFNGGNLGDITRKHPQQFQAAAASPFPFPPEAWTSIVLTLVIGITVLVFVHLYVASVLRFVYFDAVATGRFRLREGWSRWHSRGVRWFLFNLMVLVVVLGAMAVILVPAFLLGTAAVKTMGGGSLFLLALIGFPIGILVVIVAACLGVLLKDFAIPMMALENISPFEAFKRVILTAWRRKGEHAGYLGMKVVLAIAFGIAVAIVQGVIMLIILVPIIGAVIAGGVLGAGQGGFDPQRIFNNPALLALIVVGIVLVVFLVIGLAAIVLAPGLFFFEAYVLTWFAQRYEPLWNLLYPAPPPPPAPVEPIVAPEPPPLPAV